MNTEDEVVSLEYGMSTQLLVASNNVARYSISKPLGWEASVKDSLLTITAPEKGEDGYEKEGTISSGATRHLPAHLPDTRQWSRATPACSSA